MTEKHTISLELTPDEIYVLGVADQVADIPNIRIGRPRAAQRLSEKIRNGLREARDLIQQEEGK